MTQDQLHGLLAVIPLLLMIYLMMIIDKKYLNKGISRLFSNRLVRIVLAVIILIVVLVFFNGQHKGLLFLI